MDYAKTRSSFAHWATDEDIKSSLYKITFNKDKPAYGGIPLCSDSEAVYVEHEDSHSLIIGATGAKKTRLISMPAIKMYAMAGESFIATDPKAELYHKSYQTLKDNNYRIFVLNLRDPSRSNAWNPLIIPYNFYRSGQTDKAVEMVIDIADCIAHEDNTREPYWGNSAVDLLAGLILILFKCADEHDIHFKSLRAVRAHALQYTQKEGVFLKKYFLNNLDKSSFLYSLLAGTAEVADVTRSCIVSVFDQAMRPFFCQDNLINLLSFNEIDINTIGTSKTAVFLIIPDDNTLYNTIISVFVKQCYTMLLHEAQQHTGNRLPVRVNFLLDEFSSLPTISDFPAMITASRSRNIRFNLIIQSLSQLTRHYGLNAETIKGNCDNLVYLHSREIELLNNIVNLSGMKHYDIPLVSVSMLQTLNKNKGEVFVLHKRFHPYIAQLWDIDQYPNNAPQEINIPYPENTYKANSCFNFEKYCLAMKPETNADNNMVSCPLREDGLPWDYVEFY